MVDREVYLDEKENFVFLKRNKEYACLLLRNITKNYQNHYLKTENYNQSTRVLPKTELGFH